MVELHQVSAGYFGEPVVEDVSLAFRPGEVLVLLGPNGSGKSTILKAALGLIQALGGDVRYDGIDIRKMKKKEIARKAAFLTQSRSIPSIQALRMVLHGRFPYLSYPRRYGKEDYAIARKAMDMTGSRPHESTNVTELSGGQRQGVYLAMVLAQDAETVFMDEPTTYLDVGHQLRLMETARALADEGKAVVLVLHDLALAMSRADRVAVFGDGRMRMCGEPEAVYASGVLNEVFGVQVHRVETPHGMQYYCVPGNA